MDMVSWFGKRNKNLEIENKFMNCFIYEYE